jgi:hypothetical protein
MSEKTMVTIGDDVTLGAGCVVQCHSQEDYAFKSADIRIGSGCTVGIAAMVHYGTTMQDGAVLAPDSFLMKGEEMPEGSRWGGNPAVERGEDLPVWRPHDPAIRKRPMAHRRNPIDTAGAPGPAEAAEQGRFTPSSPGSLVDDSLSVPPGAGRRTESPV